MKSRVWKDTDNSGDTFYVVETENGEVTVSAGADGDTWLNIDKGGSLFLNAEEVEEVVRLLLKVSLAGSTL